MNELMQKWQQLETRERRLVAMMGAAIVIGLFYFAIWSPLHDGVANAQQRVKSQQNNLTWMQRSVAQVIQSKGQPSKAANTSGSLSQRVSRSANSYQIRLSRIQPQKGDLSIRIDSVEFNAFLSWLQAMEEQGIQAISLDVSKSDKPGTAEIRRLLLRSAS